MGMEDREDGGEQMGQEDDGVGAVRKKPRKRESADEMENGDDERRGCRMVVGQ